MKKIKKWKEKIIYELYSLSVITIFFFFFWQEIDRSVITIDLEYKCAFSFVISSYIYIYIYIERERERERERGVKSQMERTLKNATLCIKENSFIPLWK